MLPNCCLEEWVYAGWNGSWMFLQKHLLGRLLHSKQHFHSRNLPRSLLSSWLMGFGTYHAVQISSPCQQSQYPWTTTHTDRVRSCQRWRLPCCESQTWIPPKLLPSLLPCKLETDTCQSQASCCNCLLEAFQHLAVLHIWSDPISTHLKLGKEIH